uniref:Cysteine proteinase n=1 Tax=Solanum tuberosum TaxID=4113 RepID=M1A006_SOLTU
MQDYGAAFEEEVQDYGAAICVGAEACFVGECVMTPIGKQLALDSCTTFAVGDHVSAKLALDNIVYEKENVRRKAIVLSKQELFDCVERQGQSMLFRYAYKHIVKEGLHLECHYPYLAVADQVCQCPSLLVRNNQFIVI